MKKWEGCWLHGSHNQTTGTTKLDLPSAHRHEVIGSKQVIIGCGGGLRHECASKYSPVAQWMSEVDLTLHDESQQYGNLDETAAIARLPRNCLVMWLGEHRQTPGGLRKSTAARRFRRKLLKRRQLWQGSTKHFTADCWSIPYGYSPLSCISSGRINDTGSTPPAKCSKTLGAPCEWVTWGLWSLAERYCSPHSACNPLVGHT